MTLTTKPFQNYPLYTLKVNLPLHTFKVNLYYICVRVPPHLIRSPTLCVCVLRCYIQFSMFFKWVCGTNGFLSRLQQLDGTWMEFANCQQMVELDRAAYVVTYALDQALKDFLGEEEVVISLQEMITGDAIITSIDGRRLRLGRGLCDVLLEQIDQQDLFDSTTIYFHEEDNGVRLEDGVTHISWYWPNLPRGTTSEE